MAKRIFGPTGSGRRRRFLFVPVLLVGALALILIASASGVLSGSPSKFESGDDPTLGLGNMVVDTAGDNDWKTVSFSHVSDLFSSGNDDSFTSGQKQDTTCPDVSGHQNPPKDDFTDIATFSETNGTTGDTYLYGATIRVAANGNASENVELNQGTNGLCTGSSLFARVAGDKLIAIDYKGGGSAVEFHVLTWVDTGACFVGSDTAPCWGATVVDLSGSGFAEGGVNGSDISAANNPISNADIEAGQFAEFGVNLSGAGIISSATCNAFSQAVFESRSSGSSFVSSTKDISISPHPISNCGRVIIHKVTVPSPDPTDTSFGYTTDVVTLPATTTSPFSLKDGGTNDIENVKRGSYSVIEDDPSPNFVLTSIDCSASDLSHGSTVTTDTTTRTASFTLKPDDTIECTYTNTLQTGAISILKNSTKTGAAVKKAGAVFSYDGHSVTDNGAGDEDSAIGSVCVSGLLIGDYTVNETSPPPGYGAASETNLTAHATSGTNCTDNLPSGTGVVTFTDPPLADIQVRFRDGGSGETSLDAPLSCDNATGTPSNADTTGWDKTLTVTGVQPGATTVTITCTIKIDP
jgi:hypothetical protein